MTAIFQSSASIRDRGFIASAICFNPSPLNRKNSLNGRNSLSERNVSKLEYYNMGGGGKGGWGGEEKRRREEEGEKGGEGEERRGIIFSSFMIADVGVEGEEGRNKNSTQMDNIISSPWSGLNPVLYTSS